VGVTVDVEVSDGVWVGVRVADGVPVGVSVSVGVDVLVVGTPSLEDLVQLQNLVPGRLVGRISAGERLDFGFELARRAEYEVIGSKGGLKCHNVWAKSTETPVISWWTEAGEQAQESLELANHFCLEIEHFSHCVLHKETPRLSLDDAKENCQIIHAVLESIRHSKHIKIA
jgi:predicted dehydrogenase